MQTRSFMVPLFVLLAVMGCDDVTLQSRSPPADDSVSASSSTGGGAAAASAAISAGASTSSAGTGGGGGVGGQPPQPECVEPSDCPGVDNECRARTCSDGRCGYAFVPMGTPLPEQTPGDCATVLCGAGHVVSVYEESDVLDDGNDCTDDICTTDGRPNPHSANNTRCVSDCYCPPCDAHGAQSCKTGACVFGVCEKLHRVVCLTDDYYEPGCNYFSNRHITWAGGECRPGSSSGYCPHGEPCHVTVGTIDLGWGTCL